MRAFALPVTIADGATESAALNLNRAKLVGIHIPAGFEGTSIKFTAAPTETGTYLAVYDDADAEVDLTVAASRYIAPALGDVLASLAWIKLVVASQTGAITLTLIVKEL